MAKKVEEESWLDAAFDEKKAAQQQKEMNSKSTKIAGCGCAIIVVLFIILGFVTLVGAISILG